MEERKNYVSENESAMKTNFEAVDFDRLEEMDEVVTPGWGTVGCCTN